jgi:hypothetical protein
MHFRLRTALPARQPRAVLSVLLLGLFASGCAWHGPQHRDVLAISDEGMVADPGDPATFHDDSVKFFDARTGARLANAGVPPDTGLVGPAAVLFPDGPAGGLLVVNQNQFQPTFGEVRHYDPGGRRLPDYVPATAPNAPWAPRGAVVVGHKDGTRTLFVADEGDPLTRGRLLAYTLRGGQVVDRDHPVNLDPHLRNSDGTAQDYHPRAAVLGPDGHLYVTLLGELRGLPAPGCGGSVLRFDPHRLAFIDVVIENPMRCRDNLYDLHRPEGLAFSPAGDLLVTSYRQRSFLPGDVVNREDNDRLLIIGRQCLRAPHGEREKACRAPLDRIDLWRPDLGQERAYATAMVFGPGGRLYVPISTSGEVRRYDLGTKAYTTFIAPNSPGGPVTPQYLSFGRTDPATLLYDPPGWRKGER